MGDLSELLPQIPATVQAIYDHHVKMHASEPSRGYLGGSEIGAECSRFLWFRFRGLAPMVVRAKGGDHPGRMYRLFETGHLEEPRLIRELRAIGCEVVGDEGEQIEVETLAGHFKGHLDGAALGIPEAPKTWHLLEFKTHNDRSFCHLKKHTLKKSKPRHWAQMQVYMGLAKLTRGLYLARNKDTDELYSERVKYDAQACQNLLDRAAMIVRSSKAPERAANRPDAFVCKWCDAKELCWGTGEVAVPIPDKTCRSCCHATADTEAGGWLCEKFQTKIEDTRVGRDCPAHLLLPDLVVFADPVDADDGWIEFANHEDGATWCHGDEKDMWTTEELITQRGPMDAQAAEGVPF